MTTCAKIVERYMRKRLLSQTDRPSLLTIDDRAVYSLSLRHHHVLKRDVELQQVLSVRRQRAYRRCLGAIGSPVAQAGTAPTQWDARTGTGSVEGTSCGVVSVVGLRERTRRTLHDSCADWLQHGHNVGPSGRVHLHVAEPGQDQVEQRRAPAFLRPAAVLPVAGVLPGAATDFGYWL